MPRMMLKKMPPLRPDHPMVKTHNICPACHKRFQVGDSTTLVEFGPGDDPVEQRKARTGQVYTAQATAVHWSCATGEV